MRLAADSISPAMMICAAALAALVACLAHASKRKIAAALLAGVVIAALNFGIEWFGAERQIYYVHGLWPLGQSALSLSLAWMFFTMSFALGSELVRKRPRPALARYLGFGIIAGILSDYLGEAWTGHFVMGPNGNWFHISLVWLSLTPFSILLFRLFAGRTRP
jgi:hypothetical protein